MTLLAANPFILSFRDSMDSVTSEISLMQNTRLTSSGIFAFYHTF